MVIPWLDPSAIRRVTDEPHDALVVRRDQNTPRQTPTDAGGQNDHREGNMVTCVVTIHGIGFQVPPKDDRHIPGYADKLHTSLSHALGTVAPLGDDPARLKSGIRGPVYVHSNWPPGTGNIEEGIGRLGTWAKERPGRVTTDAPLIDGDQPLAHVALVYANLEEKTPAVGPLVEITAMALTSLGSYTSLTGLLGMGAADIAGLIAHWNERGRPTPSLQVRRVERVPPAQQPPAREPAPISIEPAPTGLLAALRQLENDVAAYVTRNVLRQRVHSFVNESLLRLAYRPDVDGIVVNSHSQGTVVAFDVLRDFPVVARDKIKAFVTAGSPLRKYVDLFQWGREVGCLAGMGPWTNFWDPSDPVADPLNAPLSWRRGKSADRLPNVEGLFRAVHPDSGELEQFWIKERQVDNLRNSSGGGLQAHNYWDNAHHFVKPLSEVLKSAAGLI
jgi:hypothetical protein